MNCSVKMQSISNILVRVDYYLFIHGDMDNNIGLGTVLPSIIVVRGC